MIIESFGLFTEFENNSFLNMTNTIPNTDQVFIAEWDAVLTIDHEFGIVENKNGIKLKP